MTEQRLPPADRPAASDIGAILLATFVAPIGPLLVNMLGYAVNIEIAALERMMAHPSMADVISFIGAIYRDPRWMTLHAYVIAWLGVVPAMMLLRAIGWLRLWTALPAGAVFPLATVSAITLLMWHSTSAATSEKFVVYGMLVAMTVPAAVAAAAAFWGVYARTSGRVEGLRSRSGRHVPRETRPNLS